MQCATCPNIINYPKINQKYCIICNSIKKQAQKKKKKPKKEKVYERMCNTCFKKFMSEYKVEKYCSQDCRNFKVSKKTNEIWIVNGKKKRTKAEQKKLRNAFNKDIAFPVHLPKEKISGV